MYNPSNFMLILDTGSLINITTDGTAILTFTVENNDPITTLYNLSFQLTLSDGVSLDSSSIPYTSVSNNVYSFINIKDLAPNEINYQISFNIKLSTTFSNGNTISFGTLIPCTLSASADTMPRGIYDNNNEVIQSSSSFSVNVSQYIIYKVNPPALLLGKSYSSKIIITTSENSGITFDSFNDILGNGISYLGNISIKGYSSTQLNNFTIQSPNSSTNSFQLLWTNVWIPKNTTVTIQFDVQVNEKYYMNGTSTGSYIQNKSSITNNFSWSVAGILTSYIYEFIAFEVILKLVMSKYVVDINEHLVYSIYFYANLYHSLLNLSGYLTTSDGQILSDTSTPMYTSMRTSSGGVTQVSWNVGTISAGTSAIITINGNIASQYIKNGLNILSGDTFTISTTCNAISAASNQLITSSDSGKLQISIPSVSKIITGYYYSDNSPKSFTTIAPGDFISYQSTYNSSNINAPSNKVKFFDFYPYMTRNILDINYGYSSTQYPGTSVVSVNPYGVMWYVNQIPGSQSFEINYTTQINNTNISPDFPYNLFKLQVENSYGISYSNRSQVGFTLGKPNLTLNKTVNGNNVNVIKIGETYSFKATLTNDNSKKDATDAFNITFTESIPNYVTLNYNSIIPMINNTPISWNLENNSIIVNIPNLAPDDVFTLGYNVAINNTLGPNQSFIFTSSTTAPYTQKFNLNNINIQYNVGALTSNSTIKSAPISLKITSDSPTKIVGDTIYYTLDITFPIGQILSSFYGLILIPSSETYLNQAWLNNIPITATTINSTIIFPILNNIDTTLNSISYSYKIKCLISDSIVSSQNPLYTIETFYGNISYVTMLNTTSNLGINSSITINHPYINMNIGSSNILNGFISPFMVGSNNIIYTKITTSNLSNTPSNNVHSTIAIPTNLNFNSIQNSSPGVTSLYDNQTNLLSITIDTISSLSSKYIILKSNIFNINPAESKLIITGETNSYYNDISTTKIYTSSSIHNNELYLNSLLRFIPLSPYSITGSTAAINLSSIGKPTEIEYILSNTGQGYDSYKLSMTPIAYAYDVYISSTFVQSVSSGSNVIVTSALLNNVNTGNSLYISFKYTIPIGTASPYYSTMLVSATSLINSNTTKLIPTTFQDP